MTVDTEDLPTVTGEEMKLADLKARSATDLLELAEDLEVEVH